MIEVREEVRQDDLGRWIGTVKATAKNGYECSYLVKAVSEQDLRQVMERQGRDSVRAQVAMINARRTRQS